MLDGLRRGARRIVRGARRRVRGAQGGVGASGAAAAPVTKVAFVHVPKCGGTSFDHALRRAAGVHDLGGWIAPSISRAQAAAVVGGGRPELAVPMWLDRREYLLWHYLTEGHPVVSGHGPVAGYVLDRFADATPFVTVLRDPVERWISYYRYSKLTSDDPNIEPNLLWSGSPEAELEAILESPTGSYLGSMLAIFFGGHRPYSGADPAAAVAPAIAVLERFRVVGFVDDWPAVVDACRLELGLRLEVPVLNRSDEFDDGGRRAAIDALFTPAVRDRIAALCAADRAIYAATRLRFADSRGGSGPDPG